MMDFSLAERARKAGYRLHSYETIDSTNRIALDLARSGDAGPLWIVATEQTAGRGRRGRIWQTPRGNLGASLLRVLDRASAAHAASLGFVAGLALHEALNLLLPDAAVDIALDGGTLAARAPRNRFALKWPNDLMADGAKLAGIMLESEWLADGRLAVVVGIGVNIVAAPQGLPYPATSLAALGVESDAATVFASLSEAWHEYEAVWDNGAGMPEIRRLWLARAMGLGAPVSLQAGGRVLRGTFESIDDDGRLVIRLPGGGREAITAAEVHFGGVASVEAGS
jgi:BirA family transcriptional regulator, biotin operon repressor / biotin---[acetyl-CoA-carboxylase] ligase